MKRLMTLTIAAMAIFALAGAAFAATTTGTVAVSATVLNNCAVSAGGTIPFGNLDPITAPAVGPIAAAPAVSVTCTNGLSYSITDDDGLNELVANNNRLFDGGTGYIVYTTSYTAGPTVGSGVAQDITMTGSIGAGAYSTAPAGAYSDTITLTVTY